MATQSYVTFKVNGINMFYQTGVKDTVQVGSTLTTGIYGVWNGDGSNNLTVKNAWNANGNAIDSKSGANGTIATPSGTTWTTGTMSFGSGKLGSGAFTFSGSNFIVLPTNTLTFTNDFSFSMWIYVPTTFGTNYCRLLDAFDNGNGYTNYFGWECTYSNGAVNFAIYPGISDSYYAISVPMTLKDQWVHVVVTKPYAQQGNTYINGTLGTKTVTQRGSGAANNAIAYFSGLGYIGASYYAYSPPYFTPTVAGGFKIDAVQTWDGSVLDQTAVTELYNSGSGQDYPFTLSNALIPTLKDSIGSNHGTRLSNTLSGGILGPSFATGKIGQGFTFDGINDFISLPNGSLSSLGNSFSYSLWVKQTTSGYASLISTYTNTGGDRGFYTRISNGAGGIQTYAFNSSGTPIINGAGFNTLALNTWTHIVVTLDGSNIKTYKNGSLVDTTSYSGSISYGATTYPSIGNLYYAPSTFAYHLSGSMDAVNVWTKTLTQSEVTELYNSGNGKQYPY